MVEIRVKGTSEEEVHLWLERVTKMTGEYKDAQQVFCWGAVGHSGGRKCTNCGCEVEGNRRNRLVKGRCPTCYDYFKDTGRDRPESLYQRARQKQAGVSVKKPERQPVVKNVLLCDCGRPATAQLQVTVGVKKRTQVVLELCEACKALEETLSNTLVTQ